jgi:hypothetical protein
VRSPNGFSRRAGLAADLSALAFNSILFVLRHFLGHEHQHFWLLALVRPRTGSL